MFELGHSFEYLQGNSRGVIFDMNNQIVLYDASKKHFSKKTLVIFSRITNNLNCFDFAEDIVDVSDLKNSNTCYLFYKNITNPDLKNLIVSKNKNIASYQKIVNNWNKIYNTESFKENLFKSLEIYIQYHNFQKYLDNFMFEIKNNYQHKFMGDSYSSTYLRSAFRNDDKNQDKFSDSYINKLLEFNICLEQDPNRYDESILEKNREKYDIDKRDNERKAFLVSAIQKYDAETHIKTILFKKGLYDISLDEYTEIKRNLSFYSKSLINLFAKKLNDLNNKEKLRVF